MKKIFLFLMSMVLILATLAMPTLAATQSTVTITIEPTQMNVTVPSSMPFVFNEDGTNTYPNNITITNNSAISNIYLSRVDMDGSENGWKLLKDTYDVTNLSINEKATIFKIGLAGDLKTVTPAQDKSATGVATWTQNQFTIKPKETKNLAFEIERGSFSEATSTSAYNIIMTYQFCSYD